MQFARDWILGRARIEAIVSLPRGTFRNSGTAAKTSILFLTKLGASVRQGPTMLASVDEIGLRAPTSTSFHTCFSDLPGGQQMAMVRFVDSAHPGFRRRMDADYWDPRFTELEESLRAIPGIRRLGDFLPHGRIVTAYKGVVRYQSAGTPLVTSRNIISTGIDWGEEMRCVESNGPADPARSRLIEGDVLLVRSGVGCAAECAVARIGGRILNV